MRMTTCSPRARRENQTFLSISSVHHAYPRIRLGEEEVVEDARPAPAVGPPGCCGRLPRRRPPGTSAGGAAARPRRRRRPPTRPGRAPAAAARCRPETASHKSRELGVRRPLGSAYGAEAGVAPHPAAVLALHGVVQDAATQRRLRTGRVVLDRAGQQLVEAVEAGRAVDEVGDRRRLLRIDAGRDVDQDQGAHELGRLGGQRDGGEAAERHADHARGRRGPARRRRWPGRRRWCRRRASRRARRRSARARAGPWPAGAGPVPGRRCPRCGRSVPPRAPARARGRRGAPEQALDAGARARPRRRPAAPSGGPA